MSFLDKSKSQMEIYSPAPKIKIKKWYEKICSACVHVTHDFGEYDNTGWYECDKNQRLGNLNSFPVCNAKSCKNFSPKRVCGHENDYWAMLSDFEKYFFKQRAYKKLFNLLDFNERMGDYKVGRIY